MKIKKSELTKIIASEISAFLGKRRLGSSSMDKNQLRIDGESEPLKDKTLLTKLVKDLKTMMSKKQVNNISRKRIRNFASLKDFSIKKDLLTLYVFASDKNSIEILLRDLYKRISKYGTISNISLIMRVINNEGLMKDDNFNYILEFTIRQIDDYDDTILFLVYGEWTNKTYRRTKRYLR